MFYPEKDWLSTKNNQIVNEKGDPQIFRGVNVCSINWGYDKWNPRAVNYAIKEWNANIIRTRIYPEDFYENKQGFYWKMERQIIDPARRHGVYVILHGFYQDSYNDLPDDQAIKMWGEIAEHYKNDPIIIYDPIPEPHNTTKEKVREKYNKVIKAIRNNNPWSLVMVTGLGWGREINSYLENPMPYDNIVYRSNPYNRPGEFEALFGQIAKEYPVFLTEFGVGGTPIMTKESVKALLEYAEELGIGWTVWNFHSEGCPCLLKDWKTFAPSEWGEIVYDKLHQQPQIVPPQQEQAINSQELIIYDDSFKNGFIERGWERTIDLQNQEEVYLGKKSIKLKYNKAYSGINLYTYDLINPQDYSNLQFYINYAENPLFDIALSVDDARENTISELQLKNYLPQTDKQWKQVIIPLKDFELENQLLSGIAIKEASKSAHKSIYLDEIKLNK
jgi:hypothetical protein